MPESLRPGLTGRLTYVVGEDRTVPRLMPESPELSALPPVLATAYLVALVEWACMTVLADHLTPGEQSLGVHVDLSHVAPSPVGSHVTVDVRIAEVRDRRVRFTTVVHDDAALICEGTHERALIHRRQFDERLQSRRPDRHTIRTHDHEGRTS